LVPVSRLGLEGFFIAPSRPQLADAAKHVHSPAERECPALQNLEESRNSINFSGF